MHGLFGVDDGSYLLGSQFSVLLLDAMMHVILCGRFLTCLPPLNPKPHICGGVLALGAL